MEFPKYLARPTDHTIFERQKNGMYRHLLDKKHYSGHDYSYEKLIECEFYPCEESELSKIREKSKMYYQWLSWHTRSDGHGGIKGGTMEDFLKLREKYEI
jgi:hypothetical protein